MPAARGGSPSEPACALLPPCPRGPPPLSRAMAGGAPVGPLLIRRLTSAVGPKQRLPPTGRLGAGQQGRRLWWHSGIVGCARRTRAGACPVCRQLLALLGVQLVADIAAGDILLRPTSPVQPKLQRCACRCARTRSLFQRARPVLESAPQKSRTPSSPTSRATMHACPPAGAQRGRRGWVAATGPTSGVSQMSPWLSLSQLAGTRAPLGKRHSMPAAAWSEVTWAPVHAVGLRPPCSWL